MGGIMLPNMAKNTPRDKCWQFAYVRCHRNDDDVTAEELGEMAGVSERTARDVLKTMVSGDILEQSGTTYSAYEYAATPYQDRPEGEQ